MRQRGRRLLGHTKGYLISHLKAGAYALAYSGLLPVNWRRRLIARFWESQAKTIHAQWGREHVDYGVLGEVLRCYQPGTLLDAGCGSGRLFPLYRQCGIRHIAGVDISEAALEIARKSFPEADLRQAGLTELDFADDAFDFCVCNRVLQHVPSADIRKVVQLLGRMSRMVYVNELTESDGQDEAFFMKRHDYRMLFDEAGLDCVENGLIGRQTYFVFSRHGTAATENQRRG